MEAIQEYIDKKKKRIYFGIKIYGAMVLAAALAMILLAHGDIKRLWNEMSFVIFTTLAAFVAFLISLVVIKVKMVLDLEGFTSEEQSRILREAGKMPQVYDFLITSDALIFTIRYRVYVIAVKDIVWAYGDTTERTQVYRSGSLFVPVKHSSHYLTVVLKNAKRIQVPLNASGKNWKAEVAYACKVIERKRPKAYLGYLPEMEHLNKEEFAAMVDFVEKGGTTNGGELEVQYGLNRWYQEEIPDYDVSLNENIHGVIRAEIDGVLFVVMLFGIVLAGLFFYFIPTFGAGDAVAGILQRNMWRFFAPAVVIAALLAAMLIVYIKTVICHPSRRKYGRLHVVYIIMFIAWSLFFTAFLLLASKKVYGVASYKDYQMYRSGEAENWEGALALTEEPVDVERGVKIIKEDSVYYLQSPEQYYKIPKELYDGSELVQGTYSISYLPHTKYVISLKDSAGNERLRLSEDTAGQAQEGEIPTDTDTQWRYGDIVYPKNPGIYGYENLTEDEQKVFDFLYSRVKTKELEENVARYVDKKEWEDTSALAETFSIPVEITKDSYKKIIQLFEANQKFDSYDPVSYGIQKTENGKITELYAGMKMVSEPLEENGYHLKYQELVQKTVQAIQDKLSPDASDREKMDEIRKYFKKNCKPFDDHKWFNRISDDPESEEDQKIYKKMDLARSGYGLLKTGSGKERAYMEAFGALARGLGLSVVPVMNEDELQYWNKVCLDGKWYNIDLYQMAADSSAAKKYDLVSDRQMKQNGMENGTYGGDPALKLP